MKDPDQGVVPSDIQQATALSRNLEALTRLLLKRPTLKRLFGPRSQEPLPLRGFKGTLAQRSETSKLKPKGIPTFMEMRGSGVDGDILYFFLFEPATARMSRLAATQSNQSS